MRILLSLFLSVMFISCISAISISPSTLSITGYPGESIEKNVTISNTESDYVVSITHSIYGNTSEVGITLNYTTPLIVNGSKNVTITFILDKDIIPQNFKIDLNAQINKENMTTINQIVSGGGGSTGKFRTASISENKTKIVELENKIIQLEQDKSDLLNVNGQLSEDIKESYEPTNKLFLILFGVIGVGVVAFFLREIVVYFKSLKGGS
jgi:hypothetical protein